MSPLKGTGHTDLNCFSACDERQNNSGQLLSEQILIGSVYLLGANAS